MDEENKASLAQQLLDITKQMLNTGKPFSIIVSMTNFSFSANSQAMETPVQDFKKKYKSPSQRKHDLDRKQTFMKHKLDSSNSALQLPSPGSQATPGDQPPASEAPIYNLTISKCEECEYQCTTTEDLHTQVKKHHFKDTLKIVRGIKHICKICGVSLSTSQNYKVSGHYKFKYDQDVTLMVVNL